MDDFWTSVHIAGLSWVPLLVWSVADARARVRRLEIERDEAKRTGRVWREWANTATGRESGE